VIAGKTLRPVFARAAQAVPSGTASTASVAALSAAATRVAETSDWTQGGDICRSCGACCSYSADWPRFSLESDAQLERIPPALIAEGEGGMRCTGARCNALVGAVGRSTSCAIYPIRPDVCVACLPGDAACLEARRHYGL
jgi:hypothetical protein